MLCLTFLNYIALLMPGSEWSANDLKVILSCYTNWFLFNPSGICELYFNRSGASNDLVQVILRISYECLDILDKDVIGLHSSYGH